MSDDIIKRLREAIAAGPTPGPWSLIPQHGAGPMLARQYVTGKQMQPTGLRLIAHFLQRGDSLPEDKANASLIAAASPDNITALLDRLEAAERENERLREDAERYWWLTDDHPRQETRERVHEVSSRISVSGKGHTDAAIDAARREK